MEDVSVADSVGGRFRDKGNVLFSWDHQCHEDHGDNGDSSFPRLIKLSETGRRRPAPPSELPARKTSYGPIGGGERVGRGLGGARGWIHCLTYILELGRNAVTAVTTCPGLGRIG